MLSRCWGARLTWELVFSSLSADLAYESRLSPKLSVLACLDLRLCFSTRVFLFILLVSRLAKLSFLGGRLTRRLMLKLVSGLSPGSRALSEGETVRCSSVVRTLKIFEGSSLVNDLFCGGMVIGESRAACLVYWLLRLRLSYRW